MALEERKSRRTLYLFTLAAGLFFVYSCERKTITRPIIDSSPAVMDVPFAIEAVSAAVETAFATGGMPAHPINLSKFKLYRYGEPGFPSDFALQQAPENNPQLRTYGKLTAT